MTFEMINAALEWLIKAALVLIAVGAACLILGPFGLWFVALCIWA